jgi:hypothetical protein
MLNTHHDAAMNDPTLIRALLKWAPRKAKRGSARRTPPHLVLVSETRLENGQRVVKERYWLMGGGVYVGRA